MVGRELTRYGGGGRVAAVARYIIRYGGRVQTWYDMNALSATRSELRSDQILRIYVAESDRVLDFKADPSLE